MTKLHVSPTCSAGDSANSTNLHNTHTLRELSVEEIISLLEDCSPDSESTTCTEDEPTPTIGEIRETESKLFTQITASLSETGMPYGQAVLMLAIYATTIEDRVRMALMC